MARYAQREGGELCMIIYAEGRNHRAQGHMPQSTQCLYKFTVILGVRAEVVDTNERTVAFELCL